MKTKVCKKCGQEKPLTEELWLKRKEGNLHGPCKSCRNKQARESSKLKREEQRKLRESLPIIKKYSKKCSKCKEEKPLESNYWYKENGSFRGPCKECKKEQRRINPEAHRKGNKKWIINNPGKVREMAKKYRSYNSVKLKEKRKKYYLNNLEKIKKQNKKYQLINSKKIKEKLREYYFNNSEKIKEGKRENIRNLDNSYIKQACRRSLHLSLEQVTPDLIKLKRFSISEHRLLKSLRSQQEE